MVHFGDFDIDLEQRRLVAAGQALHLTPRAFDLLWLLVEAAPRVVTKTQIHARLWPGGVVSDATVVGLVKEIRRVLVAPAGLPVLRTVHRIGYALDAPVVRLDAASRRDHWLIAGTQRIALAGGENIIGRDPAVAVWCDHASVSRRHARVTLLANRTLLEDLGSKNGTRLRGERLSGAVTLRSGDEFACGQILLCYQQSDIALPTATVAGRI